MTPLTQESVALGMCVSRNDSEVLAEPPREQCSKTRVDLRKQVSQMGSTVIKWVIIMIHCCRRAKEIIVDNEISRKVINMCNE